MTQTDYFEIYSHVYEAYEHLDDECEDEYIKSSLGNIIDHMILLRKHNLITES